MCAFRCSALNLLTEFTSQNCDNRKTTSIIRASARDHEIIQLEGKLISTLIKFWKIGMHCRLRDLPD